MINSKCSVCGSDPGFDRITPMIEDRFGVTPDFGCAGGCVTMVLELETGHVIHVNDARESGLRHIDRRSVADGFSVQIWRDDDACAWGEDPILTLTRYVDVAGLPDLIADAISALLTARSM